MSSNIEIRSDIVIRQHFFSQSVVVMEGGEIKFRSTEGFLGSFEEASEYVKENYGYNDDQIEILRNDFEIDFDY